MNKYVDFLYRFKWGIVIAVPLIVFALASNLKDLQIDGSYRIWFEKDSKTLTEFTMYNLTDSMSYSIVVDVGKTYGIIDPIFLRTVEKFYAGYQRMYPHDVRDIFLLDTLKRYNKIMNNSETVPKERNLIAQYLLLYSMDLPQGMEITDKMDFDQRKLHINDLLYLPDLEEKRHNV